jgi:Rhs element Vgr protein
MATVNDLATFDLLVNGSAFEFSYDVLSITVVNEINRITTATIIIRDGEPSSQDFPVSDSSSFVPGSTIEIKAGFNSTNATIFKGIVTGHSVRCIAAGGPELVIEAKDASVKMTIARNNAYYTTKTDSDIITALIGNYSGLSNDVDSTTYQWPEVIQYYATDWDFMLARAEVNGMFVMTDQNKVSVKQFKTGSSAVTYTYGLDIYAFVAGMDARRQLTGVSAQGWDYKTQAIVSATAAEPSFPDQGNLTATSLTSATAPSAFLLSTTAPLETAPLQSWANAQLARSRYAKIKGSIKVLGTSTLLPGSFITLAGMGSRFNGLAFVSGIRHNIGDGEWFTTISTGIDDNWFVDKVQATVQPAAGLLPGVRGLVNATVKAISSDPDNETRVQLDIPVIAASGDGVWARMANQYATNGAGFFWMPEVGDEVVVGFLNEDPRFPIIVGSLYSGQKAPPYTPDDQNSKKGIWSNSKIYIEFDDQNKNLTITTPGANKIIFSDQNQNITIQDQNSNQVVMSSSGIKMTSPKDIELDASGNIKISGTQGVTITSSAALSIQATQGLTAKGMTVEMSADTQMTVKGGATAEYSSGGQTALKGAIVMIN